MRQILSNKELSLFNSETLILPTTIVTGVSGTNWHPKEFKRMNLCLRNHNSAEKTHNTNIYLCS